MHPAFQASQTDHGRTKGPDLMWYSVLCLFVVLTLVSSPIGLKLFFVFFVSMGFHGFLCFVLALICIVCRFASASV